MEKITINVLDSSKRELVISLLKELDFVEIDKVQKERNEGVNELKSIYGIWKNREITKESIRKEAWNKE